MWVEIQGGSRRIGQTSELAVIRRFHADYGSGETELETQGYVLGESTIESNEETLTLRTINVTNIGGRDEVELQYFATTEQFRYGDEDQFNDGRHHEDGDDEFYFDASAESVRAYEAVDFDGNGWSGTWEIEENEQVLQPGAILIWKKWMDKNTLGEGVEGPPTTVPTNQTDALSALGTYLPNGGTSYESSPPRIMKLLGADGVAEKLLCISVGIEPDGPFVCRTARFQYKHAGWAAIYG